MTIKVFCGKCLASWEVESVIYPCPECTMQTLLFRTEPGKYYLVDSNEIREITKEEFKQRKERTE